MNGPNWERNENEKAISQALEKVAKEIGAKQITSGTRPHLPNASRHHQLTVFDRRSRPPVP